MESLTNPLLKDILENAPDTNSHNLNIPSFTDFIDGPDLCIEREYPHLLKEALRLSEKTFLDSKLTNSNFKTQKILSKNKTSKSNRFLKNSTSS